MFETHVGPVARRRARPSTCGRRPRRGSSSTSRTCSSSRARSRRSGSPRSASRSATRSRPATSSSAPASSSRWRWSSSCPPDEAERWHEHWMDERMRWYTELGIRPDHLRLRAHGADELSHYSSGHHRHRVPVPDRLVGARGDRQPRRLRPHPARRVLAARSSSTSTSRPSERYVPHVIEPAAGVDRAMLAFLVDAYDVEEVEGRQRTVLRLHPRLAPVKVAVLPLVSKDGHAGEAREIFDAAAPPDPAPSTTRAARSASATAARTRSAPPGGSPIDGQTMEDDTVTLRDRDSLEQDARPDRGPRRRASPPGSPSPGGARSWPEARRRAARFASVYRFRHEVVAILDIPALSGDVISATLAPCPVNATFRNHWFRFVTFTRSTPRSRPSLAASTALSPPLSFRLSA